MSGKLPPTASIALPGEGARLTSPSAERNADAICTLLETVTPREGEALELASGTGQHVVSYASRLPGLQWQPSEINAERRASIDAHSADSTLGNIAPAIELNAAVPGWAQHHGGKALVVLVNLLHLISGDDARTVVSEAAKALKPGGHLVVYGPFMRGGELTSDGDVSFHASLIAADPRIGYKDDFDVMDLMQDAGLEMVNVVEMPANNLGLVAEKL